MYNGDELFDPKTHSNDSTPPVAPRSLSSDSSVQGAKRAGEVDPTGSLTNAKQSKDLIHHFFDNQLADDIKEASGTPQSRVINDFFLVLALCHTALAGKDVNGNLSYKAQSPDEAALVQTAADVGYVFLGREPSTQILRLQTPHSPEPERYELLNLLDFTSARKRMSVILRRLRDSQLLLLCKGADQVIFERLAPGAGEMYKGKTGEDLDLFANEGLRTLCLAHKILSGEFSVFNFMVLICLFYHFLQRRNTASGMLATGKLRFRCKTGTHTLKLFQARLRTISSLLVQRLSRINCKMVSPRPLRTSSAQESRSG